jgi:hypothetical protein
MFLPLPQTALEELIHSVFASSQRCGPYRLPEETELKEADTPLVPALNGEGRGTNGRMSFLRLFRF